MRITKEQLIAGYPPIEVRNLLRRFRSAVISAQSIQRVFNVSSAEAQEFLGRMVKLGLLEPSENSSRKNGPPMKSVHLAWHSRMPLPPDLSPGRRPVAFYENSWIVSK
jgi:hypothetical protein